MALVNQIGDLLRQYANGHVAATPEEAHAHYDQIASNVPSSQLASVTYYGISMRQRRE